MLKKTLLIILLFSANAISGQWPIITSIKTVPIDDLNYEFHITQKPIEIGSSVDIIMPYKYIELTHKHVSGSLAVIGAAVVSTIVSTSKTDTISKTVMDMYNSVGSAVSVVTHNGANPAGSECVAYIVSPSAEYRNNSTPWSSAFVPGGCLVVPPADEWCKITTPEIVLEHGTITLKQADGDIASASLKLKCTTPTAVTFSLITDDKYVYLDDGKSEITIGNQPLDSKIDLPEGDSQLPVKDLLTGVTKEGFHTGSSVLVMMPY
ncbi:PapG chaperone-binding domain-containing protein [Enterobacter asburiae]|uniref:PapG chaperone-binding domain-containing protein n=1 Tax=Enterobacter asburiae TaxID=61645 RepID=UPI0032AF3AA2